MTMDSARRNDDKRVAHSPTLPALALRTTVIAIFATIAIGWLVLSLVAIVNFAFRYPAYDQYRLYPTYLGLPFPANVIQSENGHHPIVPILVRIVDIAWAAANQQILLAAGTGAAVAVLGIIVFVVLRERAVPATTRAAAALLGVIALFWLGNARTLMHGYEQGQVYCTLLATVLALLAVQREQTIRSGRWLALAGFFCICATFSFGAGLASFVAVFALAVLCRLRPRNLVLFGSLAAASLCVYLFALPGDRGVRGALAFDPAASAAALTRWLSSPWMRSFLGAADPPLDNALRRELMHHAPGRALLAIANLGASLFGEGWVMRESVVVGAIGLCGYVLVLISAWRHRDTLGRARAFGFGLATFALTTGIIVCAGRLTYFAQLPMQVFADRYSPWPCMFWLGLGLYAMTGPRSVLRRQRLLATMATLAIVLAFAPSQRMYTGWSAAAHRYIQQAAVASQLGILDPERNVDVGYATPADTLATLKMFRDRHLTMYAEPAYALIEADWRAPSMQPPPLAGATAHVVREFDDAAGSGRVAAFEGMLPHVAGLPRDPMLVVVDAQGSVRGLAKVSFLTSGKSALRFRVARKRGFDGYVLKPEPGEVLQLLIMRKADKVLLGSVPLPMPASAGRGAP